MLAQKDEEQMSWNDVAEVIGKMTERADSDLYLRPAVKILAEKFVAEMRALRFPTPRVQADESFNITFEWGKKLRLVITSTGADLRIAEDE
jgi:hypothetical protein